MSVGPPGRSGGRTSRSVYGEGGGRVLGRVPDDRVRQRPCWRTCPPLYRWLWVYTTVQEGSVVSSLEGFSSGSCFKNHYSYSSSYWSRPDDGESTSCSTSTPYKGNFFVSSDFSYFSNSLVSSSSFFSTSYSCVCSMNSHFSFTSSDSFSRSFSFSSRSSFFLHFVLSYR